MNDATRKPIERSGSTTRMSKIVRHGDLIFLCGQTSSGSDASGIVAQTEEVLRRIDALLTEAGSDRSRLLAVTIHLRSMSDFAAMNGCWERWLEGQPVPARTTVQAELASPTLLVEMTVTAAS